MARQSQIEPKITGRGIRIVDVSCLGILVLIVGDARAS